MKTLISRFLMNGWPLVFLMAGCGNTITPEIIEALARDSASFCMQSDLRGGAGAVGAMSGGYGQGTLIFCRRNRESAKVSIGNDGVISIDHAKASIPKSANSEEFHKFDVTRPTPIAEKSFSATATPRNFDSCELKWVVCKATETMSQPDPNLPRNKPYPMPYPKWDGGSGR